MSLVRENVRNMAGYVPGEQPGEDEKVIKLNTNENPYPPARNVLAMIHITDGEQVRKYPDPTCRAFREAAAKVLDIKPGAICCGNGGDELLNLVIRAVVEPGGKIAYPVPTYSLYPVLAAMNAVETVEVDFPDDFSLPAGLAEADAPLTVLCNPNAPSGTCVSSEQVSALADKLDGVLLVDEAYVDFAEGTCLNLVGRCENVLILRSLSKGYSLAGIRFGFVVGNPELIGQLNKVRDSYNCNVVAQRAARAAILDRNHFQKNVDRVIEQRKRLMKDLAKLGLEPLASEANFILVRVVGKGAKQVYEELKKRGILIRYFDLPRIEDCLRITVGTPRQNDALIEALGDVVRDK